MQGNGWGQSKPNLQMTGNRDKKTYTYTAYTEPEYQGVTEQVPYTGGSTETYTQHHQRPLTPSNLRGGIGQRQKGSLGKGLTNSPSKIRGGRGALITQVRKITH